MGNHAFDLLDQALAEHGPQAAFDLLARDCLDRRDYRLLFEARLLRARHHLGLPLIHNGSIDDLPAALRPAYEQAFLEAAREAGGLFLADGNIAAAWPFFRALGDSAPVAQAIDRVEAGEGVEPVIEIAFLEGVNPYKGFQLLLAHYGTCRAISSFEQYPARTGRDDCARLLVRTLHHDLVERLTRAITDAEGQPPEAAGVSALLAGRDWLFGEYTYYIDTSHLFSVIRYSAELDDPETLRLAVELCDYSCRLSSNFQYRGDPPFENIAQDYGIYLRALLGQDADAAIAHFRRKTEESDPQQAGTAPAQILVGLLARLARYPEAIDASVAHLRDADPARLICPSLYQLCQLAGDFTRLKLLARDRDDLLAFTAASLSPPPLTRSRPARRRPRGRPGASISNPRMIVKPSLVSNTG